MVRTPGIFQFPSEPAQCLLGQCFNVFMPTVLEQLRQGRGQQFRSASIRVGFEPVPVTITDAETLMQISGLFDRLLRPFAC